MAERETILSGMQPSGSGHLHLGNLEGALKNWVELQDDYNMYCCIVDWHSLTGDYDKTELLKERIFNVAADYLAAGLDPEKCAVFIQSDVKEHAELHLIFSMIVTVPTLSRLPTYLEKKEEIGLDSYGFLGYPVLQAADICIYNADKVPVGKDQEKHIWLAADIAGRFNNIYSEVFRLPEALFKPIPLIKGSDGRKMSKSYNNHLLLAETAEESAAKLKKFYTDPKKVRKGDPGHPDECPIFLLHKIYSDNPEEEIAPPCRTGELGCVECKQRLIKNLNEALTPIRERRSKLEQNAAFVWDVLKNGGDRARKRAREVMDDVRAVMKMDYYK
jgi:tryptophanyl-tRNA synthetase